MEPPTPVSPITRNAVDWVDARSRFHRYLRPRFAGRDEAFVQDLVSEAVVDLVLAFERGPVTNLDGLIGSIAVTTERDAIRRLKRHAARFHPLPECFDPAAPDPAFDHEEDDPLYRMRWVALEYFARSKLSCCDVARPLFSGLSLLQIAELAGRSHDSVRQQWSRCRAMLVAAVKPDRGPLWEWIHERE